MINLDPALRTRVITALMLSLAVFIFLSLPHFFWWGRPVVASVVLLLISLVALETYEMCRKAQPEYPLITGAFVSFFPPIICYGLCLYFIFSPRLFVTASIALGVVASLSLTFYSLGFLLLSLQKNSSLSALSQSWALYSVQFLFVVLGGSALLFLSVLEGLQIWAIFWLLLVICGSDIASYFVGKSFGTRRVVSIISPGKTLEGYLGGAVLALFIGVLAGVFLLQIPMVFGLILSILVVLSGWSGDLFASWLKRQANLKESGSVLPGHGGVLDRIDAVLFASPLFLSLLVVFSGLSG